MKWRMTHATDRDPIFRNLKQNIFKENPHTGQDWEYRTCTSTSKVIVFCPGRNFISEGCSRIKARHTIGGGCPEIEHIRGHTTLKMSSIIERWQMMRNASEEKWRHARQRVWTSPKHHQKLLLGDSGHIQIATLNENTMQKRFINNEKTTSFSAGIFLFEYCSEHPHTKNGHMKASPNQPCVVFSIARTWQQLTSLVGLCWASRTFWPDPTWGCSPLIPAATSWSVSLFQNPAESKDANKNKM